MIGKKKIIITFIISLIVSYLLIGYISSYILVCIKWAEDVTIWQKLREYYIRTFNVNIIPSLILALIFTFMVTNTTRDK